VDQQSSRPRDDRYRRTPSWWRLLATVLLVALCASCDTALPMLRIVAFGKNVVADDGFVLTVRDLHLKGH
jgi:hypothetical protein